MTAPVRERRLDLLIAEDDPDDLFLLMRALARVAPGLRIATTRDGIELCETIEALSAEELPQLVLLDLNLPRRDGREVLAHLRQRGLDIPTVVLTTSVERHDHDQALALGAQEVIAKPDTFGALVERLADVLKRQPTMRRGAPP